MLDNNKIRLEFPIINEGKYIYLDSGASSQKPDRVIDAISRFYRQDYANIHRGLYDLSVKASELYDVGRERAADFINSDTRNIVFTRGTTEGINSAAFMLHQDLKPGDEIIISEAEHHSNIVPWQMLRDELGVKIKIIPIDGNGNLLLDSYSKLLNEKTKIVSVTGMSNVLGSIFPIAEIVALAHQYNAKVLIDGAQHIVHNKVDVKNLDVDFYVFSAHKLYGPTGIGVMYVKEPDSYRPYHGGGDMIKSVTFEQTVYADPPSKFEAGTPHIAGVVGLTAAIDYLNGYGISEITSYEEQLYDYAYKELKKFDWVTVYSNADQKSGVISFNVNGAHHYDVASLLAEYGVCVRSGYHCAEPLHKKLGVDGTVRISFGVYNNYSDIDVFIKHLHKIKKLVV
jgi:cysteine desulfurase/selenocysteine lyase